MSMSLQNVMVFSRSAVVMTPYSWRLASCTAMWPAQPVDDVDQLTGKGCVGQNTDAA
jgi:hypothetical protein